MNKSQSRIVRQLIQLIERHRYYLVGASSEVSQIHTGDIVKVINFLNESSRATLYFKETLTITVGLDFEEYFPIVSISDSFIEKQINKFINNQED